MPQQFVLLPFRDDTGPTRLSCPLCRKLLRTGQAFYLVVSNIQSPKILGKHYPCCEKKVLGPVMFDILSAAIAALNRYGRNEIFDALLGRNSKYGLLEPHEIGMLPEQVEPFIRGHTNSYMKRLLADDPTLILCPR